MVDLVPVDHDPWNELPTNLVPVDHDPWADPTAAASMTHNAPPPSPLTHGAPGLAYALMGLPIEAAKSIAGIAKNIAGIPGRFVNSADEMSPYYSGPLSSDEIPEDRAVRASMDAAGLAMTGGMAGVATKAEEALLGVGPIRRATSGLPMDEASRFARATELGFRPEMPLAMGTAPQGEKITSAAVNLNGRIFTGIDHSDAVVKAEDELGIPLEKMQWAPIMDGFTTTSGRFVSRREAADIANRESQGQTGGIFGATRGLASEDVAASAASRTRVRTGATAQGLPGGQGVWGVLVDPESGAEGILWHRAERPAVLDASDLKDHEIQASLQDTWDRGFDAVKMTNYIRPGGTKPESIVVVKDLNQLRSPRAKFDPAKKLSPNILAGFGGVAAIPAAAQLVPVDHDPWAVQ